MSARDDRPGSPELDALREKVRGLRRQRKTAAASVSPPGGELSLWLLEVEQLRPLLDELLIEVRRRIPSTGGALWIRDSEADGGTLRAVSTGLGIVLADRVEPRLEAIVQSLRAPRGLTEQELSLLYETPDRPPAGAMAARLLPTEEEDPASGGLYLEHRNRPIADEQVQKLDSLARQADLLIRRLRVRHGLQQRVRDLARQRERFQQLHRISEALAGADDLDRVLEGALDEIMQVTCGERGFLMLRSELGELKVRVGRNIIQDELDPEAQRISRSITDRVARTGKAEYVVDALRDARFDSQESILDMALRTLLCVPMKYQDHLIGVIYVDSRDVCEPYAETDLEFFSAVAATAAVAIQNARLAERRVQDQQLSAIGHMASTIIHDLKGPMATIRGYAQMIHRKPSGARVPDRAATIVEEVDRLVGMTHEILEFSRGPGQLELEDVQLRPFLSELAERLVAREDVRAKQIRLNLQLEQDARVRLDPDRMIRVFENLTSNAVDAMSSGGNITLWTLPFEGAVEVDFVDDGHGMPEPVRRRAFEPFVTHAKQGGTGLGLAIVRQIVLDHGGNIEVESRQGEGTRFRIILPGRSS